VEEGVSIIVCCYNSVGRIEKTLSHLAELKLVTETELVVVDNNSSDETGKVVSKKWKELNSPFSLNLVFEGTPGLSNARKKGVASSKYSYILFCDDDNFLSTDYLTFGYKFMTSNPDVGALFGFSRPFFESSPPEWIYDFLGAYAVGPDGLDSGEVLPPTVPWGAGLWMPKEFLNQVWPDKRESKLADRTGKSLSSGGDTELCYWAKELGYKWYFLKEMTFEHLVPESRMTKGYLRELFYCFGEAEARINYFYNFKTKTNSSELRKQNFKLSIRQLTNNLSFVNRDFKIDLEIRRKKGCIKELLRLSENTTY